MIKASTTVLTLTAACEYALQAMRVATQQAADAYWRLLGEMNLRYMGDLRALESVVEEFKKPPLLGVCNRALNHL